MIVMFHIFKTIVKIMKYLLMLNLLCLNKLKLKIFYSILWILYPVYTANNYSLINTHIGGRGEEEERSTGATLCPKADPIASSPRKMTERLEEVVPEFPLILSGRQLGASNLLMVAIRSGYYQIWTSPIWLYCMTKIVQLHVLSRSKIQLKF